MSAYCWFDYSTVILTGASSGIGKDLAVRLIKDHGCNIIGIARNVERLEGVKIELGSLGHKFTYYSMDVSKKESWESLKNDLVEKGIQADILINNAGILPKFDCFLHYNDSDISKTMNINFYSAVYSMEVMMPYIMQSERAGILNIASSAALCSLAGTSLYSASKAALKSFTDAIREEVRGKCYIGLFCPGFTKTNILQSQGDVASGAQKVMDFISTDCDKMVDMIIKGLWLKKANRVLGADAKLMAEGNKIAGAKFNFICSQVMRLSKVSLFEDIFT